MVDLHRGEQGLGGGVAHRHHAAAREPGSHRHSVPVGSTPSPVTLDRVPESHVARRESLRQELRAADLDALFLIDLRNIRYLTGFTGSNAVLVVAAADEPGREPGTVLCTDGRYLTQSAQQVPEL